MSGTPNAQNGTTRAEAASDLARRFENITFDSNPMTPIKAEALLELYERQSKAGDPRAVFTLGMIEGFLEAQQPDFDSYTATEQMSERLGHMLLKRFFGSAFQTRPTDGGSEG
jgi:hypothetical protein